MNHLGMSCKYTGGKKSSKWSWHTGKWTKRAKCSALEGIINCVNTGSIPRAWP